MSAYILLSAGMGRTMQTKGTKSLLEYGETVVLDHQVKTILLHDKKADILIVTGFDHDKIVKHVLTKQRSVRIVHNQNYKLTSQTESLRLAINTIIETDYYIIHGDMIFNQDALIRSKNSSVVVDHSVKEKKAVGLSQEIIKGQKPYLLHMSYGLEDKWGQIAHIVKKDFDKSKDTINSFKNNKMTFEFINMLPFKLNVHPAKTVEINRGYSENFSHY